MSDRALAKKLEAHGAQLLADYGSYKLYDVPQTAEGIATNATSEVRDSYNTVMLNAGHLDTTKPEIKALRKAVAKFNGKRLHLIHFVGPILPAWRNQLEAAGVQIISYIPHNAYLVYGDTKSIAQLQAFAAKARHVQWDGAYLDDYKIHPGARAVDKNGKPRQIGTDLFAVQLVADPAANANTLAELDRLKLEPFKRHQVTRKYVNVVVRLNAANLNAIAAQPDVISIQPYFTPQKFCERQDQIIAGNLLGSQPSGPGYLAWLASKGFTQAQFDASGFVVDVSDSGIDNGSTLPNHFGLYNTGDTNASSRVVYNRLEGVANTNSTLEGCDGHGNLNSHIIGGYDDLSGFPFADSSGYHYGLGVCPFVKVGSSVIFDPSNFTGPDYFNLQSDAYQGGARISNNSWGAPVGGDYTIDSQSYDALVRDAQPDGSTFASAGNQEMVIVFSAGNDGSNSGTIGSPGTAKNVITVGASENVQAFGGRDGSGIGDTSANSADDITSFSSRGPCSDGRHKPEIVAPGTHVSGGVAQSPNPSGAGTASGCFSGEGVSGGVGSSFFPAGQQFYTASSGTSHSAPCVAGGCALLRQYFINNFTNPPSPAMTKAYLVNSARYLSGVNANDSLWSDNQGFGEMNLGTAFDGTPQILRDQKPEDLFTASGQSWTFTGTISDTNKPFRVTLAWTDAPGSTTGSAYNNNLDLVVTVNGNIYKGNVFGGQYSVPGGSADMKNNLESVFLPAGVSGNFSITVMAANINSDGVPNNTNAVDQDFALAVYNAAEGAVPVTAPAGLAVIGESCSPTNGVVDSGETVTVNFNLQNVGLANASNVVATLQTAGGVAFPSAPQNYGDLIVGDAPVSRSFTFLADRDCGQTITATLNLASGDTNLGLANFNFILGQNKAEFAESFDAITAPNIPTNWSSAASGGQVNWVTTNDTADTLPNAAFAATPDVPGISELVSPVIPITSPSAQLIFRNWYDLESDPNTFFAYDAAVLEISIDGGEFTDILDAGGSFVSGGYITFVDNTFSQDDSQFDGRRVWSGRSGGYIRTAVNLPSSAAGKSVQLKWRCGTDTGNANASATPGWHIDSIQILDGFYSCVPAVVDLAVNQSASPAILATNLSYTITVTNSGALAARGITLSDALPLNVNFISTTGGTYSQGNVVCNLSPLQAGASTNIIVTVVPGYTNDLTNVVAVATASADSNLLDNTSTLVSSVIIPPQPIIMTQPQGATVLGGSDVLLSAEVTGDAPLQYQWMLNGNNVSSATDLTLSLTNVQASDAGNYLLVITNAQGAATSSVAQLVVLIPPTVGPLTFNGTNFSMTIDSVIGTHYTLQYKTNLDDSVWLPLQSATGTGSPLTLSDSGAATTNRFYRVEGN